jgi:hypothetical protein
MQHFESGLLKAVLFNPKSLKAPYAWCGHLPFASWIMKTQVPSVFVELGTHSANSYFSFCQSVFESGLKTQCFAVDTWQGDEHAGNYDNEIFSEVQQHNQENYSHFSNLLRMTFDQALHTFDDESIDLLHIDGLHTYDAVKHDFETWLPKLKPGAIVLFHDTNVYQKDFGVWKYWKELQAKYPNNLEFMHSHGLGVLQIEGVSVGKECWWLAENSRKQLVLNTFENLGTKQLERCELIELQKQQQTFDNTLAASNASVSKFGELAHERYLQIVAMHGAIQQLTSQCKTNHDELNAMHQRLLDTYKSSSWQLTRPLRLISRILKRIF